jgi:hypothetical protein
MGQNMSKNVLARVPGCGAESRKDDGDASVAALRNKGRELSSDELQMEFDKNDSDGSGALDRDEFMNWLEASTKSTYSEEDIDAAFAEVDKDGSGWVEFEEFEALYRILFRAGSAAGGAAEDGEGDEEVLLSSNPAAEGESKLGGMGMSEMGNGTKEAWNKTAEGTKEAWNKTGNFFKDGWASACGRVRGALPGGDGSEEEEEEEGGGGGYGSDAEDGDGYLPTMDELFEVRRRRGGVM